MGSKKLLIVGICILILILSIFNMRINYLKENFKKDCKNTFNINDSCPCVVPTKKGDVINFSTMDFNNISKAIGGN